MLFVQSMCAFVASVADTPFPSTVVATMSQFLVGYNTGMARLAEDTKVLLYLRTSLHSSAIDYL
jgi:hypothetical protein